MRNPMQVMTFYYPLGPLINSNRSALAESTAARLEGEGGSLGKIPYDVFFEIGVASECFIVSHCHGICKWITNDDYLFLPPGDCSVEQISLEHHKVCFDEGNNDQGVFTALALVDADGISKCDICQITALEFSRNSIKICDKRIIRFCINVFDPSNIPIKEIFVVVIP